MAITAEKLSYLTAGPAYSGQQLAASALSALELAYIGTVTFTGDGATTTATLNYIDGTQELPWTPSAILAVRSAGTDTAGAQVLSAVDAGNSNKTATITFSVAPASADTVTLVVFILK